MSEGPHTENDSMAVPFCFTLGRSELLKFLKVYIEDIQRVFW